MNKNETLRNLTSEVGKITEDVDYVLFYYLHWICTTFGWVSNFSVPLFSLVENLYFSIQCFDEMIDKDCFYLLFFGSEKTFHIMKCVPVLWEVRHIGAGTP